MTSKTVAKRKAPSRSKAVAKVDTAATVNLLATIASAASDPNVDVAKMQALVSLHKELEVDRDHRDFTYHMAVLQGEINQIATDAANTHTSSRYATYAALDLALRPHYVAHGFMVQFTSGLSERGPQWVRVDCIVSRGAWSTTSSVDIAMSTQGARGGQVMTPTHASASALSYGKRYSLGMAFNVAIAKDDDGNAAGVKTLSPTQVEELDRLCDQGEVDKSILCEKVGVSDFAEIPATEFDRCRTWLRATAARVAATKQAKPKEKRNAKQTTESV